MGEGENGICFPHLRIDTRSRCSKREMGMCFLDCRFEFLQPALVYAGTSPDGYRRSVVKNKIKNKQQPEERERHLTPTLASIVLTIRARTTISFELCAIFILLRLYAEALTFNKGRPRDVGDRMMSDVFRDGCQFGITKIGNKVNFYKERGRGIQVFWVAQSSNE